jgi:multicomponent Na+:H+ antiporter subunit G
MIQTVIAIIFIVSGLFFLTVSAVGLIRLPDFYSRMHAIGKSETLGSMLLILGLAVFKGLNLESFKLLLILVFIAFANPTATHIMARVAFHAGLQPWVSDKNRRSRNAQSEEPDPPAQDKLS